MVVQSFLLEFKIGNGFFHAFGQVVELYQLIFFIRGCFLDHVSEVFFHKARHLVDALDASLQAVEHRVEMVCGFFEFVALPQVNSVRQIAV